MSTAVHGAQVVGGMQKPHDKCERAVGLMVSATTGTGGGVRGLKDRRFSGFTGLVGEKELRTRA